MYKLTLTSVERQAFDWVGYRYIAGEMQDVLWANCPQHKLEHTCSGMYDLSCEACDNEKEWNSEYTITFYVPENVAWQLREMAESENYEFPCFSDELRAKLLEFFDKIV